MTELAAGLLAYMERASAELKADPAAFRERLAQGKAEALDLIIERLNQLSALLEEVEKPENKADVEAAGGYETVKATLLKEKDYYSALYTSFSYELPELDVEALKEEAAALGAEGWQPGLTVGEYSALVSRAANGSQEAAEQLKALRLEDTEEDVELEREKQQTTKELLNILAEGKGEEAEALLITATLEDYAAAGITLHTWQRDAILSGKKEEVKGIIYSLLFTELLKLWQALAKRSTEQTGGSLELVPYSLTKPQKLAISVSKVAQKLIDIEARGATGAVFSVNAAGRELVDVRAIMRYDDNNITVLGRPLTEFDKAVHDGAAAIYAAGNTSFTVQDLYRACNGLDITNISREALAPYIESLEQSITRRLRIDATDQINAFYKGKVKKVVYENYFLPLKAVEITMTNGEVVKGYAFLDAPPLYEYSSNIKQIANPSVKLLRAGKQVRNTPEVAVITNYLIQRIDGIKNPKSKLQPKIAYEAIFTAAGIDVSQLDRTQLKRKRDIVKAKLDYFKLQGFIKDYTEYKNGRQAGGVEIIY